MDDENNPQREEVLPREKTHVASCVFIEMRVAATLTDAAIIACGTPHRIEYDRFVQLARDAYNKAIQEFDHRVDEELTRRQFAIASQTAPTNEENKS